jgi:DNA-binding XRE family transcriptional regulator
LHNGPKNLEIRNILRGKILGYRNSIRLLAQPPVKHPRKQIQPEPGPEKAFGQALREVRQSKEISQERLALEGGFDRTYVSLIERGINSPTIRVLVGMAAVLKVPPSKIVRRMEELMPTTKPEAKAPRPRKRP